MMTSFHFLRPWCLFCLPLLLGFAWAFWKGKGSPQSSPWARVCDAHLLPQVLQRSTQNLNFLFVFCSAFFMTVSLAGPTWHKLPRPSYKPVQARVLLLDMSSNMMLTDLSPNRLSRAKFKLQDLVSRKDLGPIGLLVFTGEPFVVSPLTQDGHTIAALLPTLTPDIMPVGGLRLDLALKEASLLIHQAGYTQGQLVVLTANSPSSADLEMAKLLTKEHIFSSIMTIKAEKNLNPLFQKFAEAGGGLLLPYSSDSKAWESWLALKNKDFVLEDKNNDIPLWRDEGPWFLLGALFFLLPVFQPGYLQRITL